MLNIFAVELCSTPMYSPQSNGDCERSVRSLSDGLRAEVLSGLSGKFSLFELLKLVQYRINRQNGAFEKIFLYSDPCPLLKSTVPEIQYQGDLPIGAPVLLKVEKGQRLYPLFKDYNLEVKSLCGHHVYLLKSSITGETYPFKVRRDRIKLKGHVRTGQEILEA
jgi:hypothetical protein